MIGCSIMFQMTFRLAAITSLQKTVCGRLKNSIELRSNVTLRTLGNWNLTLKCLSSTELTQSSRITSDTAWYTDTINVTRDLHNKSFYCHFDYTQWQRSSSSLTAQAAAGSYHYEWQSQPITVKCTEPIFNACFHDY
jgi:hypothetical protein